MNTPGPWASFGLLMPGFSITSCPETKHGLRFWTLSCSLKATAFFRARCWFCWAQDSNSMSNGSVYMSIIHIQYIHTFIGQMNGFTVSSEDHRYGTVARGPIVGVPTSSFGLQRPVPLGPRGRRSVWITACVAVEQRHGPQNHREVGGGAEAVYGESREAGGENDASLKDGIIYFEFFELWRFCWVSAFCKQWSLSRSSCHMFCRGHMTILVITWDVRRSVVCALETGPVEEHASGQMHSDEVPSPFLFVLS